MSQDTENQSGGLIENLVTQFSSPLDCFRELAQNAMDAGSPVIEVWTEFIPGEDYIGTIALHVDDWGEGMDEQIIDNYLTRLFSSSKEDDLTKIGKFGIGFVSVFALNPRAVLVQTGRGGEYWEVIFHDDRTFTKSSMDTPVEGTQITLFLTGDQPKYRQLVKDIRERLIFWCEHSETEITFEDRTPADGGFGELETINQPFEIEGYCPVRVEHQGTEIVCAYQEKPVYAFYNAGLTLALTSVGDDVLGERAGRYRHIGFKIKSRYLEHTLSRETIMRDENYEKAMKLLDQAAAGELFSALVDKLVELNAETSWDIRRTQTYGELIKYLPGELSRQPDTVVKRRIFRTLHGNALSLEQLYEHFLAEGRLLLSSEPNELTARLDRMGVPVIFGLPAPSDDHPLGAISSLIRSYLDARQQASVARRVRGFFSKIMGSKDPIKAVLTGPDDVYLPVVLDEKMPDEVRELVQAAGAILSRAKTGFARFGSCQMAQDTTPFPLFVVAPKLAGVMARPPAALLASARHLEAAVNRDHPHFLYLLALSKRHPRMAAYCLAKSLLLTQDRLLDHDVAMIQAAQA